MTSASELIPFLTDSRIPPYQRVLGLAWPAFLQQMLILLIHLSDRWLAGRASPEDQEAQLATQAAQTTGFYLAWFVNCYGALVSVGSTALVARFVGGHDKLSANRVLHQSAWLAVIFGIIGAVFGFMGLGQLIHLLQLDGPSADFANAYLQPVVVLLPFQLLESALIACLVGAGDTRTGFLVLGGLTLVNLPLAWSFFHGWGPFPEMGFAGISLGTSVGHLFAALLLIAILLHGRAGLRFQSQFAAPDWGFWWRILRISVPAAADTLSIALGQLVFLSLVNRLPEAARGAHGIALGWEALGYLSGFAFGTAGMTLVGQNLGAGQPNEARRCGWTALGLGTIVMSGMGVVFYVLAEPMFGLFCPLPSQQPIIEAGVPVLRLVAFAMPPLACCIILTQALRGAGDTLVPVAFTWTGFFVVRIPLAWWLTTHTFSLGTWTLEPGLMGAWLAMFVDILLRGVFFLLRFRFGRWEQIKV